ncbi:hypothetical protein ACLI4R_15845 [Natrialbaceae archaeon A-chndr2]
MDVDLPGSTNGALLVLSVAGFGFSVHYDERFLSMFFGGIIAVTGTVWIFFLSLSVYRNWKALEETGGYTHYKTEFLRFFVGALVMVVLVTIFAMMIVDLVIW